MLDIGYKDVLGAEYVHQWAPAPIWGPETLLAPETLNNLRFCLSKVLILDAWPLRAEDKAM